MLSDFEDPEGHDCQEALVEGGLSSKSTKKTGQCRSYTRGAVSTVFKLLLLAALGFISYYLAVLVGLTREALDTTKSISHEWTESFTQFMHLMQNGTAYLHGIEGSLDLLARCVIESGFCTA